LPFSIVGDNAGINTSVGMAAHIDAAMTVQ
jgi:hypothetical protein